MNGHQYLPTQNKMLNLYTPIYFYNYEANFISGEQKPAFGKMLQIY